MQINILCVGKIKEDYLKSGINEYLKRLSAYTKVNIVEVSEAKIPENPSLKEIEKVKEIEGENLIKIFPKKSFLIALDLNKKELKSEDFACYLSEKLDKNSGNVSFIIGGSYGLSNKIKELVNDSLTLSSMTFTHQMTRLIILEQIYRAFKINSHEVYHK